MSKYNSIKSAIQTRAVLSYENYKSKEFEVFKELLDEHHSYKNSAEEPSLMPISKQVSIPRYGISFNYTHNFSDDPSLLKPAEQLYIAGFRKFSISTNDTFMAPKNTAYTIPGLKEGKHPYGKQVVHDGTQTEMGNRSFSIQGFLARPTGLSDNNTLSSPSAWGLSNNLGADLNKVNIMRDVIKQKMAEIIPDVGIGKNSKYDIFVQDVSFTLNSKGEFSVQGNIPFVQLGGVKHDTLGKLMRG